MKRGNAGKGETAANWQVKSFHISQTLVSCQTVRRGDEEYSVGRPKAPRSEIIMRKYEQYEFDRSTRRLSGFAQPQVPPSADAKNRGTAIILALGAVRIAKDHGKDPKEGSSPGEKEECDRHQGGQQKDHE
jgi:hypothetical protein